MKAMIVAAMLAASLGSADAQVKAPETIFLYPPVQQVALEHLAKEEPGSYCASAAAFSQELVFIAGIEPVREGLAQCGTDIVFLVRPKCEVTVDEQHQLAIRPQPKLVVLLCGPSAQVRAHAFPARKLTTEGDREDR